MRINIINILWIAALILISCNDESYLSTQHNDEKVELTFSMYSTDFIQPLTRAVDETIRRIDLLVFDKDGYFLEKVAATDIDTTQKTFKAIVLAKGKIIHAMANYDDIDSFSESTNLGKSEKEVVTPLLVTQNNLAFWGRSIINNNKTSVEFIRNQAKVTVQSDVTNSSVSFVGFCICNYSKSGTLAPFINNEFTYSSDIATAMSSYSLFDDNGVVNSEEKYICEYNNPATNRETYVIVRFNHSTSSGTVPLYYKVFLRDADNKAYQIVRNVNYRIIVKNIPITLGVPTFEEAKNAPAMNSLYAEVMKESASVSDNSGNSLKVWPLTHMLKQAGQITSTFATEGTLGSVVCEIIDDPSGIISNLTTNASGSITANVLAMSVKAEAIIRVKYGKLERNITVIASPEYQLTASSNIQSYSTYNTLVTLTINLDNNYPSADEYPSLYPIWCYIKANNFYPIGDNKDMFLDFDYVTGEHWYAYLANTLGNHIIQFKSNFSYVANDAIVVRSQYFNEASVVFNKTP